MNVCFVTPAYPPTVRGGGEISVQLLATQLDAREDIDRVQVLSFDGDSEAVVEGIPVTRIDSLSPFPLEWSNGQVTRALLEHRGRLSEFDVIHGYNVAYTPALGAVRNRLELPTVATLNSYALLPKRAFGLTASGARWWYDRLLMPTTGRLLRKFARRVDHFVTLSEASKRVYVENGWEQASITPIPNMADPSFEVPPRTRDEDTVRVLYVGSLIESKGVRYLVEAATHVSPTFEIRIVGDGDQRAALEQYARKLGVEDRVTFVGRVPYDTISQEYANADVFAHPGIWPEPFGRTLLEAMQAGLPVVATNTGGPADIVGDDTLLCPPRDSAALATVIETAVARREEVGVKNRERIERDYAPKTVCDRIVARYRDVTASGTPP